MTWSVSGWAAGVTAVRLVGGTFRSVDVVTPRLSISVFTAYTSHITINGHRYIQLSWREKKTTATVTLCIAVNPQYSKQWLKWFCEAGGLT